jgi:hypothetical protein
MERQQCELRRTNEDLQRIEALKQHRVTELRAMSYTDYLRSPEWRERRLVHLQAVNGRCQLCNSPDRLEVHHRTYERLGYEEFADLLVLCHVCHETFHDRRGLSGR